MTEPAAAPSLLIFGGGYLGQAAAREALRRGGPAFATSRDPQTRQSLAAQGITPVDPADAKALSAALSAAQAVLITTPPDAHGCPALRALTPLAGDAWPELARLTLFVPSPRVAEQAAEAGVKNVVDCRGASATALLAALRQYPAPAH